MGTAPGGHRSSPSRAPWCARAGTRGYGSAAPFTGLNVRGPRHMLTCAWAPSPRGGRWARAGPRGRARLNEKIRERKTMPITRRPQFFPIPLAAFVLAAAATAAGVAPTTAFAQDQSPLPTTEFSLGIGYANVTLDDSPVIDGESGIRFDPTLSFSPLPDALPQLRLGVATGFTLVLDNSERALISSGGQLIFVGSSDIP